MSERRRDLTDSVEIDIEEVQKYLDEDEIDELK